MSSLGFNIWQKEAVLKFFDITTTYFSFPLEVPYMEGILYGFFLISSMISTMSFVSELCMIMLSTL